VSVLRFLVFLVGALVPLAAACAGGEGTEERVAGIVSRTLEQFQAGSAGVDHFPGRLPDDMPVVPPQYPGSELVASFRTVAEDSVVYFVILDTGDSEVQVFQYYEEALDEEPFQVDVSSSTDELTAVQFSSTEDSDVQGVVAITQSPEGDKRTSIFVSLSAPSDDQPEEEKPFELGASRPLSWNFPEDVPIYPGSTVIGTSYLRSADGRDFLVTLLTLDAQDEVIDYYREQFETLGWTVTDEVDQGFAVSISFEDSASPRISGIISADLFTEDPDYTRMDMQIRVRSGNGAGE
jgi:hypothetical protein